jgi:hypothetical protein
LILSLLVSHFWSFNFLAHKFELAVLSFQHEAVDGCDTNHCYARALHMFQQNFSDVSLHVKNLFVYFVKLFAAVFCWSK